MHLPTPRIKGDLIINVDVYLFLSIRGTLDSIRMIVDKGHINDGFALARNYYDIVMLCLYIGQRLLGDRSDKVANSDEQVRNWLHGKASLPSYGEMRRCVQRTTLLQPVIDILLKSDPRYKEIRERANRYMHYNDFHCTLINDKDFYVDRMPLLNQLNNDITDIFVLHVTCMFFMNDQYMMSSDYMDHLEFGMTPDDMLYSVAPFIMKTFDEVLMKRQPAVVAVIKEHTSMNLR